VHGDLTEYAEFYILEVSKKQIKGHISMALIPEFSIIENGSSACSLEMRGEYSCISKKISG